LAGLKVVSPQQCAECYCRDHETDSQEPTPVRLQCAWLDASRANDGPTLDCLHPDHATTTWEQCQTCTDYLFPVLSPNMPVDMAARLMSLPAREQPYGWWRWDNIREAFRKLAAQAIAQTPDWIPPAADRGIVIVGGGRYLVSAYVTIRVLRHVGCTLPIELWHLDGEMDEESCRLVEPFGVTCRNAERIDASSSFRFLSGHWWRGWQLKSFALQNCSFREVLYLDADCYPVRNPEFLFDWPPYREWGAVFWPDLEMNRGMIHPDAWDLFGVERLTDLPTESGQMLVNRELCHREVHLAAHYNQHADLVYHALYGDKDTFPIAWQRLGRRYARMWPVARMASVAVKQLDSDGNLLFLHRVHDKFRLSGTSFDGTPQFNAGNTFCSEFPLEQFCFDVADDLNRGPAREICSRLQGAL
jgi:hypothetical protein